jgi:hypothetical protein
MRIDFNISQKEAGNFMNACEAVIRNVGGATKAATYEAASAIMNESLAQVPVDTGTLLASAYLGIAERGDVSTPYSYGAVLGYGSPRGLSQHLSVDTKTTKYTSKDFYVKYNDASPGPVYEFYKGGPGMRRDSGHMTWLMEPSNGINAKNGKPASAYASIVHEDLDMPHPRGGKAKFLEDPIRNWAAGKFSRTAMTYWARAITWKSNGKVHESYNWRTGSFEVRRWKTNAVVRHADFTKRSTSVQRGGATVYKGDEL